MFINKTQRRQGGKQAKKLFLLGLTLMAVSSAEARVYTGLEVFLAKYTGIVKGKRVGLITNPTGVLPRLTPSTADVFMMDKRIHLTALFAPEHGIRGNLDAGERVPGARDRKTGLPVYSLYGGKDHRPPPEGLAKVDVLIFDIQDVGSRAYTYIWHMAECMSAAAAAGKTFIVLDRPNPLGANTVDGPVAEKKYLSFIGLYPIPRVYGMTIGELARYLNNEENIRCKLYVVPMANYRRGMSWAQTGLPWVPTSPHIPTPEAACCFAATGTIGELGIINIGVGYTLPFQTVAAPWMDADKSAAVLNELRLPGVRFRPIHYVPRYGAYSGKKIQGVQIHVGDPGIFLPATTETAILCHLKKYYPRNFRFLPEKTATFDKANGTASIRKAVEAGWPYTKIKSLWQKKLQIFKLKRKKYLIYK